MKTSSVLICSGVLVVIAGPLNFPVGSDRFTALGVGYATVSAGMWLFAPAGVRGHWSIPTALYCLGLALHYGILPLWHASQSLRDWSMWASVIVASIWVVWTEVQAARAQRLRSLPASPKQSK